MKNETAAVMYERLLRKNHSLVQHGMGDGKEAEILHDGMDDSWDMLTSEEQKQMRQLSIDLYKGATHGIGSTDVH